jgi:hypothetical protein
MLYIIAAFLPVLFVLAILNGLMSMMVGAI